ncbi:uncharacterized protein Ecym_1228 [Eremothecium cymbalariae DBVPG|uniref:SH3 domain-containing protein n=1 Tax=Eremothecium cymbalariae (strain CBS 270.75 / DBVPG 7215 / KCTC 17166 / NRRL Y-17582) TaxID=931890 RepID=G8JN11_ERECY|nr:hypothetical protein Ecym_1228 [Eremothecium cymbalariae DBVPG\
MSSSLINRSLANIKTELEFLVESNVISQSQSQQILSMLSNPREGTMKAASQQVLKEYVEALYAFVPQQPGDLEFKVGDKIEVLEKPSADWYKGQHNGRVGMFPSNYVKSLRTLPNGGRFDEPPPQYSLMVQDTAHSSSSNHSQLPPAPPAPIGGGYYQQPSLPPAASSYYQQQQIPMPLGSSSYQQNPAPPVQYQQPVAQPVVQQAAPQAVEQAQGQSSGGSDIFKKFGSKLGNAAVFGAGATMGSELVHHIF